MYDLIPYKLTVHLPSERSLLRGGLFSLLLCSSQDEYNTKDGLGVGGFPLLVSLLGTSKTSTLEKRSMDTLPNPLSSHLQLFH